MPAIISEKFRIFNAKQFLESLSEGSGDTDSNRTRMYFFVGRPQPWGTWIEIFGLGQTNFSVGESVYVGANLGSSTFNGVVAEVYPYALRLTNIGPTAAATPGGSEASPSTLTGNTSGATALVGVYRYGTEESAPAPLDNQEDKYGAFDDLIAVKRVTSSFARHVVRRYNWDQTANPKFDMWKPDYSSAKLTATGQSSLSAGKYVVMNSAYEVFACLYNGTNPSNTSGQNATNEPSTTPSVGTYSAGVYTEPSGTYAWKYLYTIPTDDVIKFLSTDFMPVGTYAGPAAVDGAISRVLIKRAGTGTGMPASATLYAAILGDGSNGKVQITTNGSGVITAVSVFAAGTGYTYGNVVLRNGYLFTDSALTAQASIGTGASTPNGALEVIIPPQGGHGADLINELGAKRIMLNVRLTYSEGSGDFPVDNDFRRIGILQDPLQPGGAFLQADTASALYAVKIQGVTTNYQVDEVISQGTARGKVVSWTLDNGSTTSGILKYYQSPEEHTVNGVVTAFSTSGAIVGATSGTSGTVTSAYASTALGVTFSGGFAAPELRNNAGELIYVENRRLITRAPDQIEDIKLVIEF